MRYGRIPDETIRRLPVYLRGLSFLAGQGQVHISSNRLAEFLHLNPSQIRKDLAYFGAFGTLGVGYNIATLMKQLRGILKLSVTQKAAMVGAGRLGSALLGYPGFKTLGFEIAAIFDSDPRKIGEKIGGVTIEPASDIGTLKARNIGIAILAVPAEAAQQTAEKLVEAGVSGILNFAPCYLKLPKRVKVTGIDIATELASLRYYI